MALGAAIYTVVKIVDAMTTSLEEQVEILDDAQQNYDNVKQEAVELSEELKTVNDRIAELNGQDSLTLVEEEELYNLKETNIELERQISLLEAKANKAAEIQANETEKLFNKQNDSGDFAYDEYIYDSNNNNTGFNRVC